MIILVCFAPQCTGWKGATIVLQGQHWATEGLSMMVAGDCHVLGRHGYLRTPEFSSLYHLLGTFPLAPSLISILHKSEAKMTKGDS